MNFISVSTIFNNGALIGHFRNIQSKRDPGNEIDQIVGWFFEERGKPEFPENISGNRVLRGPTNSTHMCSHHCAIPLAFVVIRRITARRIPGCLLLLQLGFRQCFKVVDIFLKAPDVTFLMPQGALREPKARAT